MGASHALTGAAAWIAVTSTTVPALGLMPLGSAEVLIGSVVCAGAALLPDADHPSSTVAYAFPGGRVVTGALGALAGGHRKGMHSLLAVLGIALAVYGLRFLTITPEGWDRPLRLGAAVVVAVCVAFGVKTLGFASSWLIAWIAGLASGAALGYLLPTVLVWLPLCVAVGYLVHLIGDTLTVGGVPWLWPFMPTPPERFSKHPVWGSLWLSYGGFALPILGTTGSWREQLAMLAVVAYTVWGASTAVLTLLGLM
ncbi:MAG: metal-dependent hydrolase [Microbacterium sp.]